MTDVPEASCSARLIEYLEAKVRADGAPAGFLGVVCVCIRHSRGSDTWVAECRLGRQTLTSFPSRVGDFDVAVAFDQRTSDWLLCLVPEPGQHAIAGKVELWSRFTERYLGRAGIVGARLWRKAGSGRAR